MMSSKPLMHSAQQAVIAACWLLIANGAQAIDYEPISLECLVASSQATAVVSLPKGSAGESGAANEYSVTVTKVLRGNLPLGKLKIREPAPWRESPLEFPTAEGVLFLKADGSQRWQVIGPSGEGRVNLNTTTALTTGLQLPVNAPGGRYPRDELIGAVEAASQCFDFKQQDKRVVPIGRCTNERLLSVSKQSPLHDRLIKVINDARSQGLACVL